MVLHYEARSRTSLSTLTSFDIIVPGSSQSTLPMPWLGIPGLLFSEANEASECRGGAAIFCILLNNSMPTHFLQSTCGGHCASCRVASLSANDCCVSDTEGRLRTPRRRGYILHLAKQQHANAFAATKLQWTLCPGRCGTLQHLLQYVIPGNLIGHGQGV
jgi:hypothetical protein